MSRAPDCLTRLDNSLSADKMSDLASSALTPANAVLSAVAAFSRP
ncbi:hypothetical protein WJ969_28570 [Achromobacter xylosoxidans]